MPIANAHPKKRFFIDMFTRDISLEECILDLLDNSIDGLINSRNIRPQDIYKSIFSKNYVNNTMLKLPKIELTYSQNEVKVIDTCGGIDYDYALKEAFNFGHTEGTTGGHFGVYGIGLKRAVFKLGNFFQIESHTIKNGFKLDLDVRKWVLEDENLDQWTFPLTKLGGKESNEAGTEISVTRLHNEVKMRLDSGTFATVLANEIAVTYTFLLEKFVRIVVNGEIIKPFEIPLGAAKNNRTVQYEDLMPTNGVKVRIYASVAAADARGRWQIDRAGWYVACNGRIVLHADQTPLSGWGIAPTPMFHPKYRQFIGLVFFESDDAHKLPWTTTKRGLNKESGVYTQVLNKMASISEPVLEYLSKLYQNSPADEEPLDKNIAQQIEQVSIRTVTTGKRSNFFPPERKKSTKVSIQYFVERDDLEAIRKHLRHDLSAGAIGRHTFEFFLKQEGIK